MSYWSKIIKLVVVLDYKCDAVIVNLTVILVPFIQFLIHKRGSYSLAPHAVNVYHL